MGSRKGYATVQCEFQRKNGEEVSVCPRTLLRKQVESARASGVEFLIGFEIEVVFMSKEIQNGEIKYGGIPIDEGHAWSTARALHSDDLMGIMETIFEKMERAGLTLEQFHPESTAGQFEFILPPLPPSLAVDTYIAAKGNQSLYIAGIKQLKNLNRNHSINRCKCWHASNIIPQA